MSTEDDWTWTKVNTKRSENGNGRANRSPLQDAVSSGSDEDLDTIVIMTVVEVAHCIQCKSVCAMVDKQVVNQNDILITVSLKKWFFSSFLFSTTIHKMTTVFTLAIEKYMNLESLATTLIEHTLKFYLL